MKKSTLTEKIIERFRTAKAFVFKKLFKRRAADKFSDKTSIFDRVAGKENKKSFAKTTKKRGTGGKTLRPRKTLGFGRGAIVYLIIFAVAVFFTQALRSPISAILMAFVIIWPIVNLIYLAIMFASLDAFVEHDDLNVLKKKPTKFKIQVVNHSFLPAPFVEADFRLPERNSLRCSPKRIKIAVPPSGDYVIEKDVSFAYRGTYDVGVDCLTVFDFFHIFRVNIKLFNYKSIYVMPRRFTMRSRLITSMTDTQTEVTKNRMGIERSDVAEIRQYQNGDPMKNVHWKLSSKTEELQIKNYAMNNGKIVYVFCDLLAHFDPDSNPEFDEDINEYGVDGVIELAAAVTARELNEGNSCVLTWIDGRVDGGTQMFPCQSNDDLDKIYRLFATAPVCQSGNTVTELTSLVSESQNVTLLFITDDLDGNFINGVSRAAILLGGGSGSTVEVYFFNSLEKINNREIREQKRIYYDRCITTLQESNFKVHETTAEDSSFEHI